MMSWADISDVNILPIVILSISYNNICLRHQIIGLWLKKQDILNNNIEIPLNVNVPLLCLNEFTD